MGQQTKRNLETLECFLDQYIIIGESNLKRLCALKPRILEAHLCNIEGIQTKLCHVNIYEHVSLTDKVWFTWSATTLFCSPVMWQTQHTIHSEHVRAFRWPFTPFLFAFVMLCLWHKFYFLNRPQDILPIITFSELPAGCGKSEWKRKYRMLALRPTLHRRRA